jgi:site-specific recombinase XerD
LLYEDAVEAKDGVNSISTFLGHWFIRKAMWASQASIRSNATSLKKFYTFLFRKGLIEKEGIDELQETIKTEMPEWLATLKRYDDPSIEDIDDVWRF